VFVTIHLTLINILHFIHFILLLNMIGEENTEVNRAGVHECME
jgi:hypothetical protein